MAGGGGHCGPLGGDARRCSRGARGDQSISQPRPRAARPSHTGTTASAEATLSRRPSKGSSILINFEVAGVNHPDGGDTPGTPHLNCTVSGRDDPNSEFLDESTSCRARYPRANVGTDGVRGWIASQAVDRAEGLFSAGDTAEPDGTDLVRRSWFEGLPPGASLNCGPEVAVNPSAGSGSTEPYACTLSGPGGPIANDMVAAENLNGTNDPDNSAQRGRADYGCTSPTDSSGRCTVNVASAGERGAASICFWADENEDGRFAAGEASYDGDNVRSPATRPRAPTRPTRSASTGLLQTAAGSSPSSRPGEGWLPAPGSG